MTNAQRATADQVTCARYTVSGGELAITYRPGFRPVFRLNGFKIRPVDAERKLTH